MTTTYNADQQYLFDRRYQLQVIPFGKSTGSVYGNLERTDPVLRVQFELERQMVAAADKGKINIYNLLTENRNAITRGSTVRLVAGYRGRAGLLFTGYVRKVETNQADADVITSLECGDAEPALTYATVNRSYAMPVSLAQVLQDLASDMRVDLGGTIVSVKPGVIKGLPDKTYPRLSLEGPVKKALDALLKPLNIDWTIQSEKLIILPRNGTQYVSAVVISETSGMIGTPALNEKYMTFQSLLNTQIVPGVLIELRSANQKLNGFYKVRTCKYQGDSHDAPWSIACEAEALKSPLPLYTSAQGADLQKAVIR